MFDTQQYISHSYRHLQFHEIETNNKYIHLSL